MNRTFVQVDDENPIAFIALTLLLRHRIVDRNGQHGVAVRTSDFRAARHCPRKAQPSIAVACHPTSLAQSKTPENIDREEMRVLVPVAMIVDRR